MAEEICRECGQPIKGTSDAAIVCALAGGSLSKVRGAMKLIPHMLYALADRRDSRRADLKRWFVTGPMERANYVRGPFPHEQVLRIAASGAIVPDFTDEDGTVLTYVKAENERSKDAPNAPSSAAKQGGNQPRTKIRA